MVSVAGIVVLGFTEAWIARIPWLAPPYFLAQMQGSGTASMTTSWASWGIVVILLFQMMFNAMSEELWWRGYILPRQELSYGTRAWVVNGLLWALFHAPVYPWLALAQLPFYLAVPFVTQRIKNTWTEMLIHFVLLALALIPLALGLLGGHL